MNKCRHCKSQMNNKAKVCHHCGRRQGNLFLGVLLMIIGFVLILGSIPALMS